MIQLQHQQQQPYAVDTNISSAVTVFQLSQDHLSGAPVKPFNPNMIYELQSQSPHPLNAPYPATHTQQSHFNQNAYTPSPPLQMPMFESESHYATLQLQDGEQDFVAAAARSRSPTPTAPELPARNGQKWAAKTAATSQTATTLGRLH